MGSDFGKLNLADIGKAALMAFLVIFLGGIVTILQAGAFPTWTQLTGLGGSDLIAGLAYILKNLMTNSQNQPLQSEPKA